MAIARSVLLTKAIAALIGFLDDAKEIELTISRSAIAQCNDLLRIVVDSKLERIRSLYQLYYIDLYI